MLSKVEPVLVCFTCSFFFVVRNETDGETVGRCHVAVEGGSGEYDQFVVKAWMTVAICGLKFIRFCQNESSQTVFILIFKIIWVKFPGSSSPHPDQD